jgi:hypothetical protein
MQGFVVPKDSAQDDSYLKISDADCLGGNAKYGLYYWIFTDFPIKYGYKPARDCKLPAAYCEPIVILAENHHLHQAHIIEKNSH